ncbi:MAG: hypothetical protein KKC76_01535 [Proteobacteria bacterium]|nr:hypothetical protein [Pseudomonadota bacterium]MBU4294355.1 hypothetical protein [Pseudomonadota bacterium]MCG2749142.1 hypothetical protein [Desulfobulbaceae bacterium]
MDQILATESLLPWLEPESSKVYLKVSAPGRDSSVPAVPFAFPLLDASSPLARLVPASFTDGSPQTIKDVFLLVQKDQYTFSETQVPFSNRDIDAMWRQTGEVAAVDDGAPIATGLLCPAGGSAGMPLWRSLFYCVLRQLFFHPPCPRCGKLLELCAADEVLTAAGLPAYSSSLQRFLFCPACQGGGGQTEFFAYAAPDTAAPLVKNRLALIDEFAQLVGNNKVGTDFPCQDCPQSGECFGPGKQAATRIIPLAFYPFRMIVTPARQLHAADFLSLISGASGAELAGQLEVAGLPGRAACVKALGGREGGRISLFFQDARRFPEVLYLKLALLAQISRAAFPALSHLQHADLRLSIDQFWVDFADYEGPLPYFWNFRAMPLAIGLTPPPPSAFLKVPEALGIHTLSLLWFNVLVANSSQTPRDITQSLADFYEKHQAEAEPDFPASAGFSPGNIFWRPVAQQLPAEWLALWQQALGLGWSLLRQSCQPAADFSAATFTAQLARLAEEVKQSLFAVEAVPVMAMPAEDSEGAICRILLDIRQKWMAELPSEPAVQGVAADAAGQVEGQVVELPEEEDLEKTVMMTADQLAILMRKEAQPASAPQTHVVDEAPPTISPVSPVGGSPAGKSAEKTVHPVTDEQAGLEKTVIMSADAIAALLAGRSGKATPPAPAPSEKKPAPAKQQLPDAAEAGLSETVMINPKQLEALRKMKKNDK